MRFNFEQFTINLAVVMVIGMVIYGVYRDNQRGKGHFELVEQNVTVIYKNQP